MNLKDKDNRQELLARIDKLLSEYRKMLCDLSGSPATYKKAALLYYWLRDYKNFIKNEDEFSPNYRPDFPRGSIVNINLGFNLGSELGGLHYGIVLRRSKRNNPTLIIAPMTSAKDTKQVDGLPPYKLYLGDELYNKIQKKCEELKALISSELESLKETVSNTQDTPSSDEVLDKVHGLNQRLEMLQNFENKLSRLKHGSIVAIDQIRAVSKIRLIDPLSKYDVLYGLKLSDTSMDAIDKKIVENLTKNS